MLIILTRGCRGLDLEGEAKIVAPIAQGRELAAQVSGRGRQIVWAGIVVHHVYILTQHDVHIQGCSMISREARAGLLGMV